MKKQVLLLSLLILLLPAFSLSAQNGASYRRMMAEISNRYDKSFVYESGLPLDQPYHGPALLGVNLQRDLRLLFRGGGWARMQLSLFPILGPAQWMNRGEPGVNGFGALSTPADPPLAE